MIPLRDTIPSWRFPLVTISIICVNVVVFVVELMLDEQGLEALFYSWGIVPLRFTHPRLEPNYLTLLSSMFLHGGWMHIIGNMWSLWIFGDNVEDRLGRGGFLGFYCVSGIAAGVLHILTNSTSRVPTVGASGAIAGVMGAYLLLYPRATVITLVPIFFLFQVIELPAVLVLGLWFLTNLFSGLGTLVTQAHATGVAWSAHIGGFAVGIMWAFPLRQRSLTGRQWRDSSTEDDWP